MGDLKDLTNNVVELKDATILMQSFLLETFKDWMSPLNSEGGKLNQLNASLPTPKQLATLQIHLDRIKGLSKDIYNDGNNTLRIFRGLIKK